MSSRPLLGSDTLFVDGFIQLRDQDVKQMVTQSLINKPAYFIALHHAKKYVVIGIRGTYNTTDILTDLNPHLEPFLEG